MILAENKVLTGEEKRIVQLSSVHPDLTRLTQETYHLMKHADKRQLYYFGDVFSQVGQTMYLD